MSKFKHKGDYMVKKMTVRENDKGKDKGMDAINPKHVEVEIGDAINPNHYKTSVEAIEGIDFLLRLLEGVFIQIIFYLLGNFIKYIWRYESKKGSEDLNKAKWYLEYLTKIVKEYLSKARGAKNEEEKKEIANKLNNPKAPKNPKAILCKKDQEMFDRVIAASVERKTAIERDLVQRILSSLIHTFIGAYTSEGVRRIEEMLIRLNDIHDRLKELIVVVEKREREEKQ